MKCIIFVPFLTTFVLSFVPKEQIVSDHEFIVQDYGLEGTNKAVMNLTNGLKHGSAIVIVSKTSSQGTININNKIKSNLLHLDTRLHQNQVILNSFLNNKWGERILLKPLIEKDAKSVTTIIHEDKGYRIYVNGKEFAYFEHRSFEPAKRLVAYNNLIFKIVYIATIVTPGVETANCPPLLPKL